MVREELRGYEEKCSDVCFFAKWGDGLFQGNVCIIFRNVSNSTFWFNMETVEKIRE